MPTFDQLPPPRRVPSESAPVSPETARVRFVAAVLIFLSHGITIALLLQRAERCWSSSQVGVSSQDIAGLRIALPRLWITPPRRSAHLA